MNERKKRASEINKRKRASRFRRSEMAREINRSLDTRRLGSIRSESQRVKTGLLPTRDIKCSITFLGGVDRTDAERVIFAHKQYFFDAIDELETLQPNGYVTFYRKDLCIVAAPTRNQSGHQLLAMGVGHPADDLLFLAMKRGDPKTRRIQTTSADLAISSRVIPPVSVD